MDTAPQESTLAHQLDELRTSYRASVTAPRPAAQATRRRHLVFALGTSLFGLPADELIEIERPHRIVNVPNAAAHLAGAVVIGQEVLTVLDLHVLYDIPADEKHNQWLVALRPREAQTACLVDTLLGIRDFDMRADCRAETLLDGQPITLLTRELIQQRATS